MNKCSTTSPLNLVLSPNLFFQLLLSFIVPSTTILILFYFFEQDYNCKFFKFELYSLQQTIYHKSYALVLNEAKISYA